MMTLEEAIAKATKLLNLSKSSNANEAALAAQRAQEILARYQIDAASLDNEGGAPMPEEPVGKGDTLDEGGARLATWKPILAQKIATVNACRVYTSGASIGIIGRASDVAKVRYMYGFLSGEVERLAKSLGMGHGRAYATSFRMGAVMAIGESLAAAQARVEREMRDEHLHNPAALVRIDKALAKLSDREREVDAWVRANMKLRSSRRSYSSGGGGFGAGYTAGQSVSVGGARAALGAGSRRLS